MKFSFASDSGLFSIELTPSGKSYRATIDDKNFEVELLRAETGKLDLLLDGQRLTAYVSSDGAKRWVTINGRTLMLTKSSGIKRGEGKHEHSGELIAPMPGQVRAVNVSEGETVTKGQTLLVVEAMKMEIRIQAPMDGIVVELMVKVGQTVEREQILVKMKNDGTGEH